MFTGRSTPSPQYHLEHFITLKEKKKNHWPSLLVFPTARAPSSALSNHSHCLNICLFRTFRGDETTARARPLSLSWVFSMITQLWHVSGLHFQRYIVTQRAFLTHQQWVSHCFHSLSQVTPPCIWLCACVFDAVFDSLRNLGVAFLGHMVILGLVF